MILDDPLHGHRYEVIQDLSGALLGMGITIEVFHNAGTVLLVKEPWNR